MVGRKESPAAAAQWFAASDPATELKLDVLLTAAAAAAA